VLKTEQAHDYHTIRFQDLICLFHLVAHTVETRRLKAFKKGELKGIFETKKGGGFSKVRKLRSEDLRNSNSSHHTNKIIE
jgi:hypothetical protein